MTLDRVLVLQSCEKIAEAQRIIAEIDEILFSASVANHHYKDRLVTSMRLLEQVHCSLVKEIEIGASG